MANLDGWVFSCGSLLEIPFQKTYFQQKILENPGQIRIWGLGVIWGVIFIINIIKRLTQKLCTISLLHFGLVRHRALAAPVECSNVP